MYNMASSALNGAKNAGLNLYNQAQEMVPGKETLQSAVKLGMVSFLPAVSGQNATNSTFPVIEVSSALGAAGLMTIITGVVYCVCKGRTKEPKANYDLIKVGTSFTEKFGDGDGDGDEYIASSEKSRLLQQGLGNDMSYAGDSGSVAGNGKPGGKRLESSVVGDHPSTSESVDSELEKEKLIGNLIRDSEVGQMTGDKLNDENGGAGRKERLSGTSDSDEEFKESTGDAPIELSPRLIVNTTTESSVHNTNNIGGGITGSESTEGTNSNQFGTDTFEKLKDKDGKINDYFV